MPTPRYIYLDRLATTDPRKFVRTEVSYLDLAGQERGYYLVARLVEQDGQMELVSLTAPRATEQLQYAGRFSAGALDKHARAVRNWPLYRILVERVRNEAGV